MVPNSAHDEQRAALIAAVRQRTSTLTPEVAAALQAVPRHLFLPDVPPERAYSDTAISLKYDANGLVISNSVQPSLVAILLMQANLKPGDNVLQIGTSTGYVAALAKTLVGDAGYVTALEIDTELAAAAQQNLQRNGFGGVKIVTVDGTQGYAPRAAYDCIIVLVGVWDVSAAWLQQLKPHGRLVSPIWLDGVQISTVLTRQPDGALVSHNNHPSDFLYIRGDQHAPLLRKQVGSSSLYILADDVRHIDTAALHLLLSDDHEISHLGTHLTPEDYWYGFQLYLMLSEAPKTIFGVYSVVEGRTAYGLERSGIAVFTPGSAMFTSYYERGVAHCFAGSDALLFTDSILQRWQAAGRPGMGRLRVRLVPKRAAEPAPALDAPLARTYTRRDHHIQVWLDL